jgi:thymidylate synthase ThyX
LERFMQTKATVITDSIHEGVRITTLQIRFPRLILAELNTHGLLARSTRSTRAVPTKKLIREVWTTPFVPRVWPSMKAGMQGGPPLQGPRREAAVAVWLLASKLACALAYLLVAIGVHKQHAGRILEPFMWADSVVTATEWDNFFNLRISPLAQPEFNNLAKTVRFELFASAPDATKYHLPYLTEAERTSAAPLHQKFEVSARRCSQVSYAPHDGSKADFYKDLSKAHELLDNGHMSPFEHPALALGEYIPNKFRSPWVQHRKHILGEENALGARRSETQA